MTDPDLEIRAEVDHSDPKIVGGEEGVGWSPKKKNLPQFGQKVRRGGGGRTPGSLPWIRHRRRQMNIVKLKCVICCRMRKESNMKSHFLNHMSWIKSRCVTRWFSVRKKKTLNGFSKIFVYNETTCRLFPFDSRHWVGQEQTNIYIITIASVWPCFFLKYQTSVSQSFCKLASLC